MKALVYEGVKDVRVIAPFPVACGHCCFCRRKQYSQCDNSNSNGKTGGLLTIQGCLLRIWRAASGAASFLIKRRTAVSKPF